MSLICKPVSRPLTEAELVKEIPFARRSGEQDAGNVMDPREIEEDLGKKPSASAIKRWLLDEVGSGPDFDDYLSAGTMATVDQKRRLREAWADGWAEYAAAYMRDHHPVERDW